MAPTAPGSGRRRRLFPRRRARTAGELDQPPAGTAPDPISPFGFERVESPRLAIVGQLESIGPGLRSMIDGAGPDVAVFGNSAHSVVNSRQRPPLPELISELRSCSGVLTHPDLASSAPEEASLLLNLAKAGVPVIGSISPEVRAILPRGLASLIEAGSIEDLLDSEAREVLGVRLRRSAWEGNFPTPSLSVVITTNRPDFLDHALSQARRLHYPDLEIIVVAHGFSPEGDLEGARILEAPAAMPFGQVLNLGFADARGEIVTKFDDDDWYAPEHLIDLACALHYSGASLVAKAAEFVYLAPLDITIRRMAWGSETYDSRNVAGGTFLMKRDMYESVGGWRQVNRHVDQALLDDLERTGTHWYRTHGHGYVLHRRSAGHTWDAPVDYFLESSVAQYRGLASEPALLSQP